MKTTLNFRLSQALLPCAAAAALMVGSVHAADTVKVVRLFNKTTINHRYLNEDLLARTTLTPEWINDGAVFCAAKYGE